MPGQGAYTYGDAAKVHRLTAVGATNYTYDGNGNITARGSSTYTFNAENMLASSSAGSESYVYDADGNRVVRSTTVGPYTYTHVSQWYYKVSGAATETRVQYWLGGRLVATKTNSTLRYAHNDHLGSLSNTTTTAGATDGTKKYYPYGLTRTAGGGFGSNRRFTGQFKDTETGLYFYNARYYDPTIGRFTSPDSLVPDPYDPRSYNRYSYVTNNPLKYTDPTGHCWGPARNLWGCGQVRRVVEHTALVTTVAAYGVGTGIARVGEVAVAMIAQPVDTVQFLANVRDQNITNIANDVMGLIVVAASGGDIDIRPDAIVVENAGGLADQFMTSVSAPAFTLGHFVFSEVELRPATYEHELTHVQQYEELGALFLPAYGIAQVAAKIASPPGESLHDYNYFEQDNEAPGWWLW